MELLMPELWWIVSQWKLCNYSLIRVFWAWCVWSKIEEFSIGQIVFVLLILNHRVLTPPSYSSRRCKGRKSSYEQVKYPPSPDWDRRAIARSYQIYCMSSSAFAPMWTSPVSGVQSPYAMLPPFGAIEGHQWFFQISSQWESQKNLFAFISFGKI